MLWTRVVTALLCGVLSLTACTVNDDNAVTPSQPQGLTGVWYAAYDATGTVTDLLDKQQSYTSVTEVYRFNEDGSGRWSRFYFNDEALEAVALRGGYVEGEFTYAEKGDGQVALTFKVEDGSTPTFDPTREVSFTGGVLSAQGVDGSSQPFEMCEKELAETFEELEYEYRGNGEGDGPEEIVDGNRIYGVGYGYNFILDHSKALSRAPIIQESKMEGRRKTAGLDAKINQETYTGNSLSEVANNFASNFKISGGKFGFSGEVGAAFKSEYKSSSQYEYALNIIDVPLTNVTLEMSHLELTKALNPMFKLALWGGSKLYRGRAGLKKLVSDYGTHLVMKAHLGGRVRYANVVDLSKVQGEYNLKAWAKASYSGIIDVEGGVENNFKKSYEQSKSAVTSNITVIGGTADGVFALMNGKDKKNFDIWLNTLKDIKNNSVVELQEVIPIWELIYNEKGKINTARIKEIKDYVENGNYAADMTGENKFLIGAVGKVPDIDKMFSTLDEKDGTLVRELSVSGRVVARVCSEYIPQINKTRRVTVVYPVFDNKVKYNLGYFIGNEGLAPTRVCWNDTTATPKLLPIANESKMGAKSTIYIQGGSILTEDNDAALIKEAKVMKVDVAGLYLQSKRADAKGSTPYGYPLVKVFNHVWLRENYAREISGYSLKKDADVYYTRKAFTDKSKMIEAPSGWKIPTRHDFAEIKRELESNRVANPASALTLKGSNLTGFNAILKGWYESTGYQHNDEKGYFWCTGIKADETPYFICVNFDSGNLAISEEKNDANGYSLRFIEVNQ